MIIKNMRKGFSLIELLVVISILGILSSLAIAIYSKYKINSHITWTKAEIIDLSQIIKMAKASDSYYHQYIYKMGYQPKGKIFASVGIAIATSQIPCCDKYPDLGVDPCVKDYRTGFLYYNCNDTNLDRATNNVAICGGNCELQAGVSSTLDSSDFSACPQVCNCYEITVGAKTYFDKKFSLNLADGSTCKEP